MSEMYIPVIKQQLQQQLGSEKFLIYVRLLRDWFGQRLTKALFDHEVSVLLEGNCLDLHNLLVRSILQSAIGKVSGGSLCTTIQPYSTAQSVIPTVDFVGDGPAYTNSQSQPVTTEIVPYTPAPEVNNNAYIETPIPVEEPPKEIIVLEKEVYGVNEMMEQVPPPDCDWLHEAKVTYPATENNIPDQTLNFKNRFPPWFAHDFQRVNTKNYTHDVNVVKNVTHMFSTIRDILERKPHLKPHFVVPEDKKIPQLTSGCSLYGRILLKAWDSNIQNVNHLVTEAAVIAVKEHIKNVVIKILQQRRPFRMRDKRILHSMGVPYPNPYLRQGCHLYDETYSSDTTKMADVVMQIPAPFPTLEEKERLAALQVAASYPTKDTGTEYISTKGTMMDFLCAITRNPTMIPNNRSRFKLLDTIHRNNKYFAGSQNSQYTCPDEEEDLFQPPSLLPLASY